MKLKKEVIQLDNILGCAGGANYLYQYLLKIEDVLSVKVNIDEGDVEIYCKGEIERSDYIEVLANVGFPEAGTSTNLQKGKALINGFVGMFF